MCWPGLADDIEHWLADEPISAQPDSGRGVSPLDSPPSFAGLATAIPLLLISIVSTVPQCWQSATEMIGLRLKRATGRRKKTRGQAELGFRESLRRRGRSVYESQRQHVAESARHAKHLRSSFRKTLDYYKRFLQQRADDPTIQDELGVTFFRVGHIVEELDSPEKGLPYYQQAQTLQERLLSKTPGDRGRLSALGDTYNAIGVALKKGQRPDESLKSLTRARDIRQELVVLSPKDAGYGQALASSMMNIDLVNVALNPMDNAKKELALKDLESAQQIRRSYLAYGGDTVKLQKDLALGDYNLGIQELRIAQSNLNDPGLKKAHEKPRKHFADWSELLRQLIAQEPHDLSLQYQLATCYRWQGDSADKSSSDSILFYQEARDTLSRLVEHNPDVAEYKSA